MPVMKGLNTALYVNDKVVAGGTSFLCSQSTSAIDVTDRIALEWNEYLPGLRGWSLNTQGSYIVNAEGLTLLQQAFLTNQPVKVIMQLDSTKKLSGEAVITDFPINAAYNTSSKYSIKLMGTGALTYV